MNLFLEPSNWFGISNYIYIIILHIIITIAYIYMPIFCYVRNIFSYLIYSINDKYLSNTTHVNILFISFYTIIFLNIYGFLGLILLTSSPHIVFTFCTVICLYCIGYGIYKYGIIKFILNLVPKDIPGFLYPLMICIELLTVLLRPFILTLRITLINAISHMMLHIFEKILANIMVIKIFNYKIAIGQSILVILLILDIIKTFLQAYLFTLSIAMYLKMCTEDH